MTITERARAARDWLRAQLIEDWRSFWRFWSVRLGALGLSLQTIMLALPDAARETWNTLPADLKAVLPVHFVSWVSWGLIAAGLIARVVKQGKSNG